MESLSLGTIGALIIRLRLGGIFCYSYHKEPPRPYFNYYAACAAKPRKEGSLWLILIGGGVGMEIVTLSGTRHLPSTGSKGKSEGPCHNDRPSGSEIMKSI